MINRLRRLIGRHITTHTEQDYGVINFHIARSMLSISLVTNVDPGSPEADEPETEAPRLVNIDPGYRCDCILVPVEVSPDLVHGTIRFKNPDGSISTVENVGKPATGINRQWPMKPAEG